MLWLNFLHLYQPVNSDARIIEEATEMSYQRIIRALEEHPHVKFTLNISGCLLLRWDEMKYYDLIKRIGQLIGKGQIEITGTAAYHPLLPLIPVAEVERQIKENEKILRKHFGHRFKPRGFFLPELAYSPKVAKIVRDLGYEWLILDEIAYNGRTGTTDLNRVFLDRNSGLKAVLRSRKYSNSYVPEAIMKLLDKTAKKSEGKLPDTRVLITATDGELYGLRHIDQPATFEKLLGRKDLETMTFGEFINRHKETYDIRPNAHTWATNEEELARGEPFNLWAEPTNEIQQKLWRLAHYAYNTTEKHSKDKYYKWARWHLVRGLASCTFWWASAKDFRLFGPLSWSPDEIERGTNEFVRAVRALDGEATRAEKIKAEKLYIAVKKMVWKKHWTHFWKNK